MSCNFHPQNPLCKKTEEMARAQGIMEKHMNDRNNDPKCDAEEATMQSGQWLLYHNREPFTSPAPPPHAHT